MNDQQERALAAGLKALAALSRAASASPRVEQAVLAEMARVREGRPLNSAVLEAGGAPVRLMSKAFIALAAGLLVGVGMSLWSVRHDATVRRTSFTRPSGFVELPNAGALPHMESASIVRVSLPPSALPQYGMAIVPEMTVVSIEAELLVAQDGQPRAIRLVRDPNSQRSTP